MGLFESNLKNFLHRAKNFSAVELFLE
jgi:hypothetical protein